MLIEDKMALLQNTLKPEEINGTYQQQIERVQELLAWFVRYANGQANPKWVARHAFELAYYLANNNKELSIDFDEIQKKACYEGMMAPDSIKQLLLKDGEKNA